MHPENQPPYDVLLSQLGTYRFKALYPNGEPSPGSTIVGTPTPERSSRTPTDTPIPFRIVTVDDLPVYPGAQNVQKTSKEQRGSVEGVVGVLTFDALDKSDAVFAYYADILRQRGWQHGYVQRPNYVIYLYGQGSGNPVYGLDVIAKPNETNNSTNLELTLSRYNHP